MAILNAFKMLVAFLPQSSTGSVQADLVDERYAALKWSTSNLIPLDINITNFNDGGSALGTEEVKSITDLSLSTKTRSTTITEGDVSFETEQSADLEAITPTLEAITGVDDPLLGLLVIGRYKSESTGTKLYDVIYSTAAYLTQEAGRNAGAHEITKASLTFKPSGRAKRGKTTCAYTATLTSASNTVALAATQS